jgi:hypothetical protein
MPPGLIGSSNGEFINPYFNPITNNHIIPKPNLEGR